MHMTSSVAQETPTSPHVASLDGRGSGDISPQRKDPAKGKVRYLYYRLYTKNGAIESYNHIYSNDRYVGRILTKAVAPPHLVSSLKRYLCKIEGFPGAENSDLYETLSSPSAIMPDSTRISLLGTSGIGSSVDDPAALVIGDKDFEKRAVNTDVSKDLPETPDTTDTRHVYYRVYDDVGEITSKTHFDKDDTSLGRVDVLSIAPPRTVSSLKSRLLKAEDCLGDDIQLFEDMGSDSPMDDTDVLTLLGDDYSGSTEDQPMAIVCKKRPVITSPPKPPASSKKIRAKMTESYRHYPTNWLPISTGEVFVTNGIAIQHPGYPDDPYRFKGYMATNSAGSNGFVADYASEFC